MKNISPQRYQQEYIARINAAIDYIEKYINTQLSLNEIANIAHFSPFHFHRLFKAIMWETPNQYIRRIRLEKSASSLIRSPHFSITEVALKSWFSSSQVFSREFKKQFGISPSEYQKSKICNTNSKIGKDFSLEIMYSDSGRPKITFTWNSFTPMTISPKKVSIETISPKQVIYVRKIGDFKKSPMIFEEWIWKICQRAAVQNLLTPSTQVICIYLDDYETTENDKLRVDIGITVPSAVKVSGEIGLKLIPAGLYAKAYFELKSGLEFEQARTGLYRDWLPQSWYQPDNRPCFEIYLNDFKKDPEKKHHVEIYIPIKPL